jgi:hypothetical protein
MLIRYSDLSSTTAEIRLFAKCSALCRVHFVGHSAKPPFPSATLAKIRLSTMTTLIESETFGIEGHSTMRPLPSVKLLA